MCRTARSRASQYMPSTRGTACCAKRSNCSVMGGDSFHVASGYSTHGSVSPGGAQTVREGQSFRARRDFAVELGIAKFFQQGRKLRARRRPCRIRSEPSTSGGGLSRSAGQASRSRQNASAIVRRPGDRFQKSRRARPPLREPISVAASATARRRACETVARFLISQPARSISLFV